MLRTERASRSSIESKRGAGVQRAAFAWVVVSLSVLLTACGLGDEAANADASATVSAYQTQVTDLQGQVSARSTEVAALASQVAAYETVLPIFGEEQSTEAFAATWRVDVAGVETFDSYPDYDDDNNPITVQPKGRIVAVRFNVTNVSNQPVESFFAFELLLEDASGRTFSADSNATSSYIVFMTDIYDRQPDDYQPDFTYEDAVVFDVPIDAAGFVLKSDDGTLRTPLPDAEAYNTPAPPTPTQAPTPTPLPTPEFVGTSGEAFTIGPSYNQAAFKVIAVEPLPAISTSYVAQPQGQWVVLLLDVRSGKEYGSVIDFPWEAFVLQDSAGRVYEWTSGATNAYIVEHGGYDLNSVFRQEWVRVGIVYDVPQDAGGFVVRNATGQFLITIVDSSTPITGE